MNTTSPFGHPIKDILGTPALPLTWPTARKLIDEGTLLASRIGGKLYIDAESLRTLPERLRVKPRSAKV